MKTTKMFDKIINYFILYMPLLDLITSIMTYNGLAVSAGLIIKTGLLAIIFFYLLFSKKVPKREKIIIVLFSLFLGCVLLHNIKTIIAIKNLDFLKFLIKFAYYIIMSVFFVYYFRENEFDIQKLKTPIKIVLLSIFIATITGTAMPSYSNGNKIGIEGWFYSANELGSLLTLLYPISIYLFFHHPQSKKIEYAYIIIHATALLLLGTKVGLLSFFIITTIYFIYRIIMIKKKFNKSSLVLTILLLLIAGCLWNQLPAVINSSDKYNALISTNSNEGEEKINNINEMIYSGRDQFVENIKNQKKKTSENNKTFEWINNMVGYMYLTNNHFVLTERDFHDSYLFFGIIGLIFTIITIIIPCINNFKEKIKNIFDIKLDMLILGLGVTCGCAFISGHTLLSPMVSFYISIVLGLIANFKKENKSNKKEILIASVHMGIGGIETSLKNLLNSIDYSKYNVELHLLLKDQKQLKDINKNVEIIFPYNRIISPIINSNLKICKLIKHLMFNRYTACLSTCNKKYDVAIDYSGYYLYVDYFIKNCHSTKKMIWVHTDLKKHYENSCLYKKQFSSHRKKYNYYDKVICVSEGSKKSFIELFPNYKEKCDIMYNIVKTQETKKNEKLDGKFKILSIGRLSAEKNQKLLIEAHKELTKKGYDINTYIIGSGPEYYNLENLINEYNIHNSCKLLGQRTNIKEYLEQADLFVLTSQYEAFGIVLIESLECGIPFVAPNINGVAEIHNKIAPKNSSLLVKNNLNGFCKGIEEAINQKITKNFKFNIEEYNSNNLKKFEALIQ